MAQLSVTILALALFANAAQVAQAAGFDFSEDFSIFGRQPNNLICLPGAACGAVASINSFIYLGAMFPTIYDNMLTPNKTNTTDPIDATNFGITGWTVGNNPMRLGYYNRPNPDLNGTASFLNTKKDWFNDFAPGTTVFNSWFAGSTDNNRTPTVADLAPEMRRGEDVELFVRGDGGYYHVISLTGIFCSDDAMTRCGLRYQDNDGDLAQNLMADLTVAAGGLMFTGALSGADRTVTITAAFSESPIPEPETYAMLLAGLGLLGFAARRRKQQAA